MTILFCGGEIADFPTTNGILPVSTTAGDFRATRARCAVTHVMGGTNPKPAVTFPGRAQIWLGAQVRTALAGGASNASWTGDLVAFREGGVNRLILRGYVSASTKTLRLIRVSGGTETVLATGSVAFDTTLAQLAVYVDYGATGQVAVFRNMNPVLNYVGDPRPTGSTNLDSLLLGGPDSTTGSLSHWSEVIVTDEEDTRILSLQTLTPTENGDVTQWAGTAADVDEVVASGADVISSETPGAAISLKTSGVPNDANQKIKAVKVVASAAKTPGGPDIVKIGIRQNGNSQYPVSASLGDAYTAQIALMTVNPVTGTEFTAADVASLQFVFQVQP